MSGMTDSGVMVNRFFGRCDCGREIEYALPVHVVGENTNEIRRRCDCGNAVVCRRGGMPSPQGRRAVVFRDGGVLEVDLGGRLS